MFSIVLALLFTNYSALHADTASDLQTKIDDRNAAITSLQKEIDQYQSELNTAGTQENSLQNSLQQLDLSKKTLEANLAITQDKIDATNLEITQLNNDIGKKQSNITSDRKIIATSLETIRENDDSSLIEILLGQQSLSQAFTTADNLASLQGSVQDKIATLENTKTALKKNITATQQKKADLVSLTKSLTDQHTLILIAQNDKAALLSQTKDTEANYKKIIADKAALQAAFQQEMLQYESALHLNVDPNAIPQAGSGVLHWPLDSVTITQYFGTTDFSTKNPLVYSGKGHNGIDLRAAIGTPVKAALDGVVAGVGNTGLVQGCYSYGKWVMIKHPDGLSTLYAHLSLPIVTKGQSVNTGDVIAYSGNTGNVTGPHLHFGVYATQGVVIAAMTNSNHCNGAVIPFGDLKAYLNPLSYLPAP